MRKNARRLQLQQWLLLAVRTLIILLVVLAVAEPYGERLLAGGSAASGAQNHRASMARIRWRYQAESTTNFAMAKQLAGEMVKKSPSGDVFTVILMTSRPSCWSGPRFSITRRWPSKSNRSRSPSAGADLEGTLALVHESLTSKENRRLPDRKEVYFFTDLQSRTWAPLENDSQPAGDKSNAEIMKAVQSLAQVGSLNVIDFGQPNASNLAITNLASSDSVITRARDASFDATLHAFGKEPQGQCRVELLVDDVTVGEQTVDACGGRRCVGSFFTSVSSPPASMW